MECILSLRAIPYHILPMDLDSDQTRRINDNQQTDAQVWSALKTGNSQALQIFYERYATLVYRLALRILGNPQEAEDLTQEIFLTLWRSGNYDPNRGSVSSFLTTMTRSRAIDKLRSRSTQLKFFQRWTQIMVNETSSSSPFEMASLNQRSEQVNSALAKLSPSHRQVLEMAYFDGLSQSEIAKKLNIPLGTVKSWSRLGLLNLRKNLQKFIE